MESWVETIVTAIGSAGGGGFFGWFFTRKKTNAEAKGSELENVEQAIKIWRETAERLEQKVTFLEGQIKDLQQDLITVHRENKALKDYLIRQGIDYTIINNSEGN